MTISSVLSTKHSRYIRILNSHQACTFKVQNILLQKMFYILLLWPEVSENYILHRLQMHASFNSFDYVSYKNDKRFLYGLKLLGGFLKVLGFKL